MDSTKNIEKEITITRVFDAPRELVFKVWTEPEHLAQWWGPKGSTIRVSSFDFKPGGMFHYSMEMHNNVMWGMFRYLEIAAPERIVFVSSFSDEAGNVTPNAFIPGFPLEITNVLTLTEHEGKTALTLTGGPLNATPEETQVFTAMIGNMQQGFAGTFEQLEEYLKTL